MAAVRGHARARHNPGGCHANGQGVIKDAVQAHAWRIAGIALRSMRRSEGFDTRPMCVYGLCMATKTISVDLDAYAALSKARLSEKESFSQVIKRARWSRQTRSCGDLHKALATMPKAAAGVIRRLDAAQKKDTPPDNAWS